MLSVDGYTGWVNLSEAWVSEVCTLFVCSPSSGGIRGHSIGGEVINIPVTTSAEKYCISGVLF